MTEPALRVLIVEDEADIRRFVRMALENEGHEVFEAVAVKRGLIDAGTRRPDLVVLDLGLPDGDGVDFIRDPRAWSAIPVIVLSARSAESDKIAALNAGADDYLVKPFGTGELMARGRNQAKARNVQFAATRCWARGKRLPLPGRKVSSHSHARCASALSSFGKTPIG